MLTTREEARKKWCPHVRVQDGDEGGANSGKVFGSDRNQLMENDSRACVADHCSQWRWWDSGSPRGDAAGYCGLAGVPR